MAHLAGHNLHHRNRMPSLVHCLALVMCCLPSVVGCKSNKSNAGSGSAVAVQAGEPGSGGQPPSPSANAVLDAATAAADASSAPIVVANPKGLPSYGVAVRSLPSHNDKVAAVGKLVVAKLGKGFVIRSAAGNFAFELPVQPQLAEVEMSAGAESLHAVQGISEVGGMPLTFMYLPMPSADGAVLSPEHLAQVYDGTRDQGLENLGGKLVSERNILVGGLPAREVVSAVKAGKDDIRQQQVLIYQPAEKSLVMIGVTSRAIDLETASKILAPVLTSAMVVQAP